MTVHRVLLHDLAKNELLSMRWDNDGLTEKSELLVAFAALDSIEIIARASCLLGDEVPFAEDRSQLVRFRAMLDVFRGGFLSGKSLCD